MNSQSVAFVKPPNMRWEIYLASQVGNDPVATYEALHTRIDVQGLYDILEMSKVHATWERADELNHQLGEDNRKAKERK